MAWAENVASNWAYYPDENIPNPAYYPGNESEVPYTIKPAQYVNRVTGEIQPEPRLMYQNYDESGNGYNAYWTVPQDSVFTWRYLGWVDIGGNRMLRQNRNDGHLELSRGWPNPDIYDTVDWTPEQTRTALANTRYNNALVASQQLHAGDIVGWIMSQIPTVMMAIAVSVLAPQLLSYVSDLINAPSAEAMAMAEEFAAQEAYAAQLAQAAADAAAQAVEYAAQEAYAAQVAQSVAQAAEYAAQEAYAIQLAAEQAAYQAASQAAYEAAVQAAQIAAEQSAQAAAQYAAEQAARAAAQAAAEQAAIEAAQAVAEAAARDAAIKQAAQAAADNVLSIAQQAAEALKTATDPAAIESALSAIADAKEIALRAGSLVDVSAQQAAIDILAAEAEINAAYALTTTIVEVGMAENAITQVGGEAIAAATGATATAATAGAATTAAEVATATAKAAASGAAAWTLKDIATAAGIVASGAGVIRAVTGGQVAQPAAGTVRINPATGVAYPINPATGLPYDPATGLPVTGATASSFSGMMPLLLIAGVGMLAMKSKGAAPGARSKGNLK